MPVVYLKEDNKLDDSQNLWRYMGLSKLISLLEKKSLWLARADTFHDRHEGRFPDYMRKATAKVYEDLKPEEKLRVKGVDDFQDFLRKNTFLSCWHKNSDENMVMWQIYGRNNDAVAVQTTVGRMKKSLVLSSIRGNWLKLDSITYKRPEEISGILPYEDCFFIKRPHFHFEKEVRLSLDTYSTESPSKDTPKGHRLRVDIELLIEKVLIHPDSEGWFEDVIKSIMKRFRVNALVERGLYGSK
jgi:hypothetical protein